MRSCLVNLAGGACRNVRQEMATVDLAARQRVGRNTVETTAPRHRTTPGRWVGWSVSDAKWIPSRDPTPKKTEEPEGYFWVPAAGRAGVARLCPRAGAAGSRADA